MIKITARQTTICTHVVFALHIERLQTRNLTAQFLNLLPHQLQLIVLGVVQQSGAHTLRQPAVLLLDGIDEFAQLMRRRAQHEDQLVDLFGDALRVRQDVRALGVGQHVATHIVHYIVEVEVALEVVRVAGQHLLGLEGGQGDHGDGRDGALGMMG